MHIAFQQNAWDESAVTHAYTYRFPYTNRFLQHEDAIENGANPEMADGFDYLSIMSREAFPTGTKSPRAARSPAMLRRCSSSPTRWTCARTACTATATTLRWCCTKAG